MKPNLFTKDLNFSFINTNLHKRTSFSHILKQLFSHILYEIKIIFDKHSHCYTHTELFLMKQKLNTFSPELLSSKIHFRVQVHTLLILKYNIRSETSVIFLWFFSPFFLFKIERTKTHLCQKKSCTLIRLYTFIMPVLYYVVPVVKVHKKTEFHAG